MAIEWNRKYASKLKLFEKKRAEGMTINALNKRPKLNKAEAFYYDVFELSEGRPLNVISLNVVYQMSNDHLYRTMIIVHKIASKLREHNASNTTRTGLNRSNQRLKAIR